MSKGILRRHISAAKVIKYCARFWSEPAHLPGGAFWPPSGQPWRRRLHQRLTRGHWILVRSVLLFIILVFHLDHILWDEAASNPHQLTNIVVSLISSLCPQQKKLKPHYLGTQTLVSWALLKSRPWIRPQIAVCKVRVMAIIEARGDSAADMRRSPRSPGSRLCLQVFIRKSCHLSVEAPGLPPTPSWHLPFYAQSPGSC